MGLISNIRYGRKIFDVKKLANLVEDAYMEKAKKSGHTQKVSFAPSALGYQHGTCPRHWVYAFRGAHYDYNTSPESVAVMDAGTSSHERIQDAFERAGVLVEKERELITDDPPTRGFVDAIIELDGEKIVVEIKTTNDNNFTFRKNSNTPTPYHRYQLLTYMKALGINKGAFFYENRNTGEILIVPIEMDEKNEGIIDEAWDWMREVHQTYKDGRLPMREGKNSNSVICRQCPLNKVCWDDENAGDIDIRRMEVYKDG